MNRHLFRVMITGLMSMNSYAEQAEITPQSSDSNISVDTYLDMQNKTTDDPHSYYSQPVDQGRANSSNTFDDRSFENSATSSEHLEHSGGGSKFGSQSSSSLSSPSSFQSGLGR